MNNISDSLDHFRDNYINLVKFFGEFSNHFENERADLKLTTFYSHFTIKFMTFFKVITKNVEITEEILQELFNALGKKSVDVKSLSDSELIKELSSILSEGILPTPNIIEILGDQSVEKILNSDLSNKIDEFDFQNFDFEKFFDLCFQLGVKSASSEQFNQSLYGVYEKFDKYIEEEITKSFEKEKELSQRLCSVCIIQLYTIFESFLKDLFSEIASNNPLAFFSSPQFDDYKVPYREHISKATTKEEIIELVIEDSFDNYQKWYNAEKFFKSKDINMFPEVDKLKERELKVYGKYLKVDEKYTMREKLEKLRLYRNAIIHNGGYIREKDLKYAKITNLKPCKVILDENFVRHSFNLIACIVHQIYSQVSEYYGAD